MLARLLRLGTSMLIKIIRNPFVAPLRDILQLLQHIFIHRSLRQRCLQRLDRLVLGHEATVLATFVAAGEERAFVAGVLC